MKAFLLSALLFAQSKPWTPTYVLCLEIRQTRFSLDITEHLKDEANAASFQFRAGSFGNWQVNVINKAIF